MSEKYIKWLKSKSGLLKIDKIEKELGMSQGTLRKFIAGERDLSEKWKPLVEQWIKNFKK